MSRIRCLPLLIAVLLLAQWGSAFAHCLRHTQKAAVEVQICTTEGLVALALPGDPDDAPPTIEGAACPLCQGSAPVLLPTPAEIGPPAFLLIQASDPPALPSNPPPRRCSPPPPRAPPTS